jgi:hypothetical protein
MSISTTNYYRDIRPKMRSFDLLLFKGTDVVSKTIRRIESCMDRCSDTFSHAGMVIRAEDLMPARTEAEKTWLTEGKIFVFESTMSGNLADGVPDVDGKSHLGVQLRNLDAVVWSHAASVQYGLAWCPIKEELRPSDDRLKALARACYHRYNGMFYDASIVDLLAAAIPSCRPIRDNVVCSYLRTCFCSYCCCRRVHMDDWMFCSELVCHCYIDSGILPDSVDASNVMPADFIVDPKDSSKTLDSDHQIPPLFSDLVKYKI